MQVMSTYRPLDYVCAHGRTITPTSGPWKSCSTSLCGACEYIRTLVAEMQGIIGHLFWLGARSALDIGAMTVSSGPSASARFSWIS